MKAKVRERDKLNDSNLQRDSEGYLLGGKIIPPIPKSVCPCGVSDHIINACASFSIENRLSSMNMIGMNS